MLGSRPPIGTDVRSFWLIAKTRPRFLVSARSRSETFSPRKFLGDIPALAIGPAGPSAFTAASPWQYWVFVAAASYQLFATMPWWRGIRPLAIDACPGPVSVAA